MKDPDNNPAPETPRPDSGQSSPTSQDLRPIMDRLERLERRVEELETRNPRPAPSIAEAPQQDPAPAATGAPRPPVAEPPREEPRHEPAKPPETSPIAAREQSAATGPAERMAPQHQPAIPESVTRPSRPAAPPREPWVFSEGWEVRLATRVLPVIGGVLLLVGAAIGATIIETEFAPVIRVSLGYLCAAGLVVGGWYASRRTRIAGQAAIASGLALGYFTSFGAHFLPPMRVFPLGLSLAAMAVFAVTLVLLADRWRSQPMAGLGLVLGLVGALVSAPVAETFALVSLAGMALAAGCLFLRREWMTLTTASAALVYLAVLLLWVIAPVPKLAGPVWAHLGALTGIYVILTLAFAKWGHLWVAREEAARAAARERAPSGGWTPVIPYIGGFAVVNSLGAASLMTLLFFMTEIFWEEVHWILFGLAAAESLRLVLPSLRGRWEPSFHASLAFVLVTCGLVSMTSGLTSSAVLAGAALAAAIAATRAPVLGPIRPLGALAAGLSAVAYLNVEMAGDLAGAEGGFFEQLGALIPVGFLLASALPWERLGRADTGRSFLPVRIAEVFSAPFRAIIAGFLFYVYLDPIMGDYAGLAASAGMALLLAAGMAFAGARSWGLALLGALAATFILMGEYGTGAASYITAGAVVVLVPSLVMAAWRTAPTGLASSLMSTFGLPLAIVLTWGAAASFHNLEGWTGTIIWGLGLVVAAGTVWLQSRPPLFTFSREQGLERPDWFNGPMDSLQRTVSPGITAAAILAVVGFCWALFGDTDTHVWSPVIVGATMLPLFVPGVAALLPAGVRPLGPVLAVTAWAAGWLLWTGGEPGDALLPAGLAAAVAVVASHRLLATQLLPAASVAGVIAAIGLAWPFLEGQMSGEGTPALSALGAALLLTAMLLLPIFWQKAPESASVWGALRAAEVFRLLGIVGAVLTLAVLGLSDLLIGPAVTPSWGLLGAILLGAGLLLADRTLRYTALAIFTLAVGRIFLHDMVGLDTLTRAVAFFGVGLLLLAGGVAYGLARKRLGVEASVDDTPEE